VLTRQMFSGKTASNGGGGTFLAVTKQDRKIGCLELWTREFNADYAFR